MMHGARSLTAVVLLGACLLGCGMSDSGYPNNPDGGATYCQVSISFEPELPAGPGVVVARAHIDSYDTWGVQTYSWQVFHADLAVAVDLRDVDGAEIAFTTDAPGPYRIIASATMGDRECIPADTTVNVPNPAGVAIPYRLRMLPRPGLPAPVQESIVSIVPGTDYALMRVLLSSGLALAGSVRSSASEPLAAYVRAVPVGAVQLERTEAFADDQGVFSMRLENRLYDVLVVPEDNAHAPTLFTGRPAIDIRSLTLPAGRTITGKLVTATGAPVLDARVSMRAGQVPSTIATTDQAGSFALAVQSDARVSSITVAPAKPSDLPLLDLTVPGALASSLAGTSPAVDLAYSAALETHSVAPQARRPDNTPAAGTRAIWISRPVAGLATATPQGGSTHSLAGTARISVVAGADGTWPPITLPEAVYDVILEPQDPSEAVTLLEVDLAAQGVPATLSLAAPATLRGIVTSATQVPLARIQVSAMPQGLLAQSTATRATATTAEDGSFALKVPAHGSYELTFDSPDRRYGRLRLHVSAPAPGQDLDGGTIALPAAFRVTGEVGIPDVAGGAAGVTVQLLCIECDSGDSTMPLAEAVTGPSGQFLLAVPVSSPLPAAQTRGALAR